MFVGPASKTRGQNGVTTYKYASFECLVMISAGQEDIKRVGRTKKGVVTARVTPADLAAVMRSLPIAKSNGLTQA